MNCTETYRHTGYFYDRGIIEFGEILVLSLLSGDMRNKKSLIKKIGFVTVWFSATFLPIVGSAKILRASQPNQMQTYKRYQEDTWSSLELMRNPETGLIRDKIKIIPTHGDHFSVEVMNGKTSPTNIGLDIINQTGALKLRGRNSAVAKVNLERVITSMENMPFHKDTGLYFSWYNTSHDFKVESGDVSSVDNIHLALALWTLKETFPDTPLGVRAGKLFDRMDFSAFYDIKTGLIGGNLRYENKIWTLEEYRFSNLGSEARSIYVVTWALGLMKKTFDPDMPAKSVASLRAELFNASDSNNPNSHGKMKPVLKTWDGGAFQLLLPKLLLNEETLSPQFAKIFKNYAQHNIAMGKAQGTPGLYYHSASQYGFDNDEPGFKKVPAYVGQAGDPVLVSSDHEEIRDPQKLKFWDTSMTPHAAVMAATINPTLHAPILAHLESLKSGTNRLYMRGLGFMDGYHVKGAYEGKVVPVQLSLDQGMIELALGQIESPDGLSPSSRALRNNPPVFKKLAEYYDLLSRKLENLANSAPCTILLLKLSDPI